MRPVSFIEMSCMNWVKKINRLCHALSGSTYTTNSRVQRYLEFLQEQSDFAGDFNVSAPHWTYAEFRGAMDGLRKHYGLGSFTFKQIDKFVWSEGVAP
jgi:hypothetical protein